MERPNVLLKARVTDPPTSDKNRETVSRTYTDTCVCAETVLLRLGTRDLYDGVLFLQKVRSV